ncbi:MAG: helix-turn-helix domain-containing protein [Burkholderiales bacterium]|nr:helix-turn-helix domain-containing protein [Burkholderiales bacterium]
MDNSDFRAFASNDPAATPRQPAGASCMPATLADLAPAFGEEITDPALAGITFPVRRIRLGEALVRAGDPFDAIYVIRCGFFKTVRVDEFGNEVVLGLPMSGEAIGLDGIDPGHYTADVIALDTSFVAVVPFARLAQLAREHPPVERVLYRAFSRQLGREHGMIWLLGTLNAEARVATFLLDLSDRFGRLGYSRTAFALRMTRQEIGSYLGLKLETVSRTLSALAAAGLLTVDRKTVILNDIPALRRLAQPHGESSSERATHNPRRTPSARLPSRPALRGVSNPHLALA